MGKSTRTPGSGSGKLKSDIFSSLDFLLECKNEKSPHWCKNIDQAKREAGDGNYAPEKWALIVRDPRYPEFQECYALIDLWQFLKLLKKNRAPLIQEPDREIKWHLQNLREAINRVLKDLK